MPRRPCDSLLLCTSSVLWSFIPADLSTLATACLPARLFVLQPNGRAQNACCGRGDGSWGMFDTNAYFSLVRGPSILATVCVFLRVKRPS
jgi:hypothetical protein